MEVLKIANKIFPLVWWIWEEAHFHKGCKFESLCRMHLFVVKFH